MKFNKDEKTNEPIESNAETFDNDKNNDKELKEPIKMEKGDLLAIIIAFLITIAPILLVLTGIIVLALWFM